MSQVEDDHAAAVRQRQQWAQDDRQDQADRAVFGPGTNIPWQRAHRD